MQPSATHAHTQMLDEAPSPKEQENCPQVAVLPNGEIMYLSPENPYAQAYGTAVNPQADDYSAMPSPAGAAPGIPSPLLTHFQQPILLERMARIVRLLAMFDLVFSLMNVLANVWPAAITAVMAYCGYVGARMFRRDLTRVYLVYLVMMAMARVAVSVHLTVSAEMHDGHAISLAAQVFLVISSVLQLIIANFVWKFYSLLPTSDDEARFLQYVTEHHNSMSLV